MTQLYGTLQLKEEYQLGGFVNIEPLYRGYRVDFTTAYNSFPPEALFDEATVTTTIVSPNGTSTNHTCRCWQIRQGQDSQTAGRFVAVIGVCGEMCAIDANWRVSSIELSMGEGELTLTALVNELQMFDGTEWSVRTNEPTHGFPDHSGVIRYGFTSDPNSPPKRIDCPATCQGCRNWHGQSYRGVALFCAVHPEGPKGETCGDYEQIP